MRVYLSSPYEASRADQEWKRRVLNVLQRTSLDFSVIDPCPGDCVEHDLAEEKKEAGDYLGFYGFCANIVESDLAMLKGSEGMIAYLPKDSVTFGTTHEIIYALDNNIPVVVVMPEGVQHLSRWLWGILGPNRIFDNVSEAATVLANRILVANGEKINDEVHYPSWQEASR